MKVTKRLVLTSLLSVLVPLPVRAAEDAARDFSAGRNPIDIVGGLGWSYGWTPLLGGAYTLFTTPVQDQGLSFWLDTPLGSATPTLFHNGTPLRIDYGTSAQVEGGQLGLTPGTGGLLSVLRWTATRDGIFSLQAVFGGLDFGGPTSSDVHVLLNGVALFDSAVIGFGPGPSFATDLALTRGDRVDFVVGDGGNGNAFDATSVDARLRQRPIIPIFTSAPGSSSVPRIPAGHD